MCGRYTLTAEMSVLAETFPLFSFSEIHSPRYNIAPTQSVLAVANDGKYRADNFRWGLVPHWAKDPSIGNRMINARSETLAEKPSFRTPYRKRRCLILTDGFYEWVKIKDGTKMPFYLRMNSNSPFAFAGLWEQWRSPDEATSFRSCTIVNTAANQFMSQLHYRMPVIIKPEDHERWLDPKDRLPGELADLLVPYPDDDLTGYIVSKWVNSPRNDGPSCIVPI